MTSLHLVCLKEPDQAITKEIRDLFGGDSHYVVSDTQIVVVKPPNGGASVYERIKDKVDKDFAVLIVRFEHYHGRHSPDLWSWLQEQRNPSAALA